MAKNLLLIESGGKIKKLKSILGKDWTIKASMGHIRELAKDGDDALGFVMKGDRVYVRFQPRNPKARSVIKDLKEAVKVAERVYLACDPDREGETIAWHLSEVLKLRNPTRVVYSEITPAAVKRALGKPRALDLNLVGSGLARACLDKLVGFKGSPLLWKLGNGAKSMGRVQSATMHILCQREREIFAFKPTLYWSVFVDYKEGFRSFYLSRETLNNSESIELHEDGADDDAKSPEDEKKRESSKILSQLEAERLVQIAKTNPHQVVKVEGKTTLRKPPPPFITSSLQQAAGSRLKFNPKKTMELAQKLYEKGLITYMRTDSVALSQDFCASVRDWLQGKDLNNIPEQAPIHRSHKNAQEAHEAIRPTDINKPSVQLKQELSDDEFQLYLIIWLRAVASLCKSARLRKTTIVSQSGDVFWQAKGSIVEFSGYAKYWKNLGSDKLLPEVKSNQILNLEKAESEEKVTQPPPRYSEAKLVQVMERKGIGRPSTYAPTVKTLKERNYVYLTKGKLKPTTLGLEVDDFLEKVLPDLQKTEFTAQMEASLDSIAIGKEDWESYLTTWNRTYFEGALAKANKYLAQNGYAAQVSAAKKELERSDVKCPKCARFLSKVPSKSKKLAVPYFLKCSRCKEHGQDVVMFYDQKQHKWVQPGNSINTAEKFTDFKCPVCDAFLVEHEYVKDGITKKMLRCAVAALSKQKHKNVAFFWTKNHKWWSQKFGELN